MKCRNFGIALLGISILNIPLAVADTSSENTSTVSSQSLYDRISESAALTYFGVYRGASVSDPGNGLSPAIDGSPDPDSPQSLESVITAGYKFDKNLMLGVTTHFMFYPGLKPSSGSTFEFLDPTIILNKSNLVDIGGLKVIGRVTAHLPVSSSDFLQKNNLATAITPTFIATYQVPTSPLTVGLMGFVRGYIPTASAASDVRTYKLYLAPNLNYQLTDTLAATLWVDLVQASRNGGTGFFSGLKNDPIDIEPGLNWDITKNISINPVLNIYPSNPTLKATSVQAFISAKAF